MAFKSRGGFVIRPIVTADSLGGASALIQQLDNRLLQVESKLAPANVISTNLVKLTDMTFDLTVVFSKFVRPLTVDDLELVSCSASNFRRVSDTTTVIKLTATSPVQFSYRIKDDIDAQQFVGNALITRAADVVRETPDLSIDDGDSHSYNLTTIGNPIRYGFSRTANDTRSPNDTYTFVNDIYLDVRIGSVFDFVQLSGNFTFVASASALFYHPPQWQNEPFITHPPAGTHRIDAYSDGGGVAGWKTVAYTVVY